MLLFHMLANVLLMCGVAVLGFHVLRERAMRKQTNFTGRWPIPPVLPEAVDAVFQPGPFGPDRQTEVAFLGRGPYVVAGGTSDAEAWILAVLAKSATQLFEFGTCTGKTAYLWARNAPAGARITTLTLAPDTRMNGVVETIDHADDVSYAIRESAFSAFVYSGTDVAHKVEQLLHDSKLLDVSPWAAQCDLVFVDGSHAYSYVVSDSIKALTLVRPGGLVLWHDYAGPRHCPGVFRALNELAKEIPLVRISGTALVAYRKPG